MLWRTALLTAARSLRQNILRGRIWGNPSSDAEQEQEQEQEQGQQQQQEGDTPFGTALYASSSSSLDLPLTGGDAEAGSERRRTRRLGTNANGHVRGMVDKWERESVGSRSPTCKSDRSYSRSDSESDNGSELDESEVAAEEDVDVPGTLVFVSPDNGASSVAAADEEPSIEDLLASEEAPAIPKDGSWGARAWEELDAGTTIRRVEAHDTIVPRHDGSADVGSASIFETLSKRGGRTNGSSRRIQGTNMEDLRPTRRTAADIFAVPKETITTPALVEAGVQAEPEEEAETAVAVVEAELEAKELVLEGDVRDARALLEKFRRRLEEVEERVSAMEAKSDAAEEQQTQVSPQQQEQPQSEAQGFSAAEKDTYDKAAEKTRVVPECDPTTAVEISVDERKAGQDAGGAYADGPVVRRVVDLGPTTVSDLPSYVFLVGLGVCTVVLQVVLKRVAGRSLRP